MNEFNNSTEMQVEHDKLRHVQSTYSYFHDDEGSLQKFEIKDIDKIGKLRALRNDRVASIKETGLPDEARLSRIDVTLVNTEKPEEVQAVFVGGIHADESQSPSNWEKIISTKGEMAQLPRAEIMEAHDVASMLGRRDNLVPITDDELNNFSAKNAHLLTILVSGGHMVNEEKLLGLDVVAESWTKQEQDQFIEKMGSIQNKDGVAIDYKNQIRLQKIIYEIRDLANSGETSKEELAEAILEEIKPLLKEINSSSSDFRIAKKINLNRQFPISENVQSLDQAIQDFTWPESKLLAEATKDLPNAKFIFSMHEDPEYSKDFGEGQELDSDEGFYFYDMYYSDQEDTDKELVLQLKENLANKLKEAKFYIMSGIDDPNDPSLGLEADHGYIEQPIIDKDGQMNEVDGTYETAMVALGQKGLLNIERAFCFEIPGKINQERKLELLNILQEEFIIPFLKAKKTL